ncbi:MAG: UvrD-helicase domain-containing protein [Chloroflexi bacterium]|nr:UvrD-helicase domain-containing protein [Chloroflexota bacterium]
MANRPISAKTAWYDFVLDGIEASEITYANDILTVTDHQGKTTKRLAAGDIAGIDVEEGPLRNGLTITPKRGQAVKIAGLQKKESEQIRRSLEGRIRQLQAEEERILNQAAAEKARELKPEISMLDKHLRLTFNGQKFIRQSEATELADSIRKLTNRLDARVRGQLDNQGKAALVRIDKLGNPQELETARTGANLRFTSGQTALVKETVADFMDNPLTDEQAKAVVTDEDATLVLAGAGTGKTSVITGKMAHLIRNQGWRPILFWPSPSTGRLPGKYGKGCPMT